LLWVGVSEGAETETGVMPEVAVPAEFSTGTTEAPRHAPITPATKFAVGKVQV